MSIPFGFGDQDSQAVHGAAGGAVDKRSLLSASLRRSTLMAVGAAALFGGWAYLANAEHGRSAATGAACTQGCASFGTTLFMFAIVEWVFSVVPFRALRFGVAGFGAPASVLSVAAAAHAWVGTPAILQTLAPNCVIGLSSALLYTVRLDRQHRASAAVSQACVFAAAERK
jgi:hypothetical protein